MEKIKKVILVILISPLLTAWIISLIFSEFFNELESATGDWVNKAGKAINRKLNIKE